MAESKGNNRPKRPVRPRQAPGGRKRRVVIDSGSQRGRQDSRQARERAEARPKAPPGPQPTGPVTVNSGLSVKDLSQALGVPAVQIIKIMMGLGELVTMEDAFVLTPHADTRLSDLFGLAEKIGLANRHFQITRPSLESVFLHLTGKTLRDA